MGDIPIIEELSELNGYIHKESMLVVVGWEQKYAVYVHGSSTDGFRGSGAIMVMIMKEQRPAGSLTRR